MNERIGRSHTVTSPPALPALFGSSSYQVHSQTLPISHELWLPKFTLPNHHKNTLLPKPTSQSHPYTEENYSVGLKGWRIWAFGMNAAVTLLLPISLAPTWTIWKHLGTTPPPKYTNHFYVTKYPKLASGTKGNQNAWTTRFPLSLTIEKTEENKSFADFTKQPVKDGHTVWGLMSLGLVAYCWCHKLPQAL